MNDFFIKQWEQNKDEVKLVLSKLHMSHEYKQLVQVVFTHAIKEFKETDDMNFNIDAITEVDNGEYQGTLIFLIPVETYQPSVNQYAYTSVYYGSCSGCDTLLNITGYSTDLPDEEQLQDLMTLCLHLVQNARILSDE